MTTWACGYLYDPALSDHYERCVAAILQHSLRPPEMIVGAVDARKFRSSLKIFKATSAPGPHRQRIRQALDAFYGGQECEATLKFLMLQIVVALIRRRVKVGFIPLGCIYFQGPVFSGLQH